MDRRRLGLLVVTTLGVAAVLLFGTALIHRDPSPTNGTAPGTSTTTTEVLTLPESDWCEAHLSRVANDWGYNSDGAPALTEAERLGGPLRPETVERLSAWREAHPDQYQESCRSAFATWAGREN